MSPSLELDIVAFNNLLDVNALGVLRVYKAFAPLLLRTANHPDVANKLPKDRSVIINIGSTGAVGGPWQGAYAASKVRMPVFTSYHSRLPHIMSMLIHHDKANVQAAVHALSESMSYELANMGVHVITVKLGATRSAMTANSKPFESRQPNALSSGSALPYWDDIIRKAEIAFTEQVYAKAELPTNVAKKIGDAATAGSPPQDLWVGMGAPIFRYFWAMVPLALRWKMWSAMTAVDMVRRPKVDELLVLPGQEAK